VYKNVAVRHHFTSFVIAILKKKKMCWQVYGKKGSLYTAGRKVN
jgi:hypothetical protein